MGDETHRQMDNHYRMVRRADDLTQVVAASGRPLPERTRWLQEARLSCSAHRIRILQELIAIEWRGDPPAGPGLRCCLDGVPNAPD